MRTVGLTHVAMAVPPGTLSAAYRTAVCDFYGEVLGWRELTELRRPDRLTLAVGRTSYVNLREHDAARTLTYEHLGVLVRSAAEVAEVRGLVVAAGVVADEVEEPVPGYPTFRFQHLLPMAIEVQFVA